MAITGDFVNGIHAMWRESTDDAPSSSSENTFLISMDNGAVKYWSGGEWKTADAMVCQMIAYLCGKGRDLPIVSASDNGKVLGVSNGAWNLVSGGGGGGSGMERFTVTFSLSGSTWSADKTYSQVVEAIQDGKYVEATYGGFVGPLSSVLVDTLTTILTWNVFHRGVSAVEMYSLYIASDGGVGALSSDMLPQCTAANVVTALYNMDATQTANARSYLGAEKSWERSYNYSTTPSINAVNNTFYKCSQVLTSLTIAQASANSKWAVRFLSGTTPTVLNLASDIHVADGFTACEADTLYEINCLDGEAVITALREVDE